MPQDVLPGDYVPPKDVCLAVTIEIGGTSREESWTQRGQHHAAFNDRVVHEPCHSLPVYGVVSHDIGLAIAVKIALGGDSPSGTSGGYGKRNQRLAGIQPDFVLP